MMIRGYMYVRVLWGFNSGIEEKTVYSLIIFLFHFIHQLMNIIEVVSLDKDCSEIVSFSFDEK